MEILLALLAVIALSVFFTSLRGVNSGLAPLLSLTSIMMLLSVGGVFGVLLPAGIAAYAACVGLCAFAVIKRGGKALLKRMLSPGFLVFCVMAALLFCTLAIRQPIFAEWDEYSFWGSAAKRISETNGLYVNTAAGGDSPWPATGQPALIVLSYFAQLFGQFAPWKTYWAYDILLFACAAAMLSAFSLQRIRAWVPVCICALCLPFAFGLWYSAVGLTPVWMSAYGDIPGGLLFGGAIVCYYILRKTKGCIALSALPLAAFSLCKDNLFTLALLAAGLMALDSLLFGRGWHKSEENSEKLKTLSAKQRTYKVGTWALKFAGWFAPVLLANFMWQRYAAYAIKGLAATNVSTGTSVMQAVRQILGLEVRSSDFYRLLGDMTDQFLGRVPTETGYQSGIVNMSVFGSGLVTMLVIICVFMLAVLFAQSKRQRLRNALCGGIMLVGFWLYQFGLFVVYAYFLKPVPGQGRQVVQYGRYLGSYLIGWFAVGIVLLGLCFAEKMQRQKNEGTTWQNTAPTLARVAVLALALFITVRVWVFARPGYTVLDYSDDLYLEQAAIQAEAERLKEKLEGGEHLFFVCQNGDSAEWYRYAYCMMPEVDIDASVTRGSLITPKELPLEDTALEDGGIVIGMKTFLRQRACDGILIIDLDAGFIANYGEIFEGALSDWPGIPCLYMLNGNGLYELA